VPWTITTCRRFARLSGMHQRMVIVFLHWLSESQKALRSKPEWSN